jgi:tetratricopeptide (TPR) repeat protein
MNGGKFSSICLKLVPAFSLAMLMCCQCCFGASETHATETLNTNLLQGIRIFRKGLSKWDADILRDSKHRFDRICDNFPQRQRAFYWKGVAGVHLAIKLNDKPDKHGSRIEKCLEDSSKALEKAIEMKPDDAESHALLATAIGLRIARNSFSALWLGSSVIRHRREALRHGSQNPRVHYLVGTGLFHSSSSDSSNKNALSHFLKAEKLFIKERASDPGRLEPQWGYSHCLEFTARTYLRLGKKEKAEEYFEKALTLPFTDKSAASCSLKGCHSTAGAASPGEYSHGHEP